ncbi:YDG/SRA domain-containing protein [Amycolatopsis sp. NPDC098790]|uniref:YDG/SRA domain-containing protein n=1 Tax=Amycolatopsis sp. NPDC098790 TaxID=3363939 RepID=UPI00380F2A18
MSLADVNHEHVLAAIDEFNELGREAFLSKYGFAEARQYVVSHQGQEYDSKALIGAAHRFAQGRALRPAEFSGGVKTVGARLLDLGFDFHDVRPPAKNKRVYGDIPGYPEGSMFASRAEVAESGVHRALQAGIVGTGELGAESIVSSGGYEDDDDRGEELIYTGHGGRDERGRQVADQTFAAPGNAALLTSSQTKEPVRVVRGPDPKSPHAPDQGYRYDGLYRVEAAAMERGQGDYLVCRFQMIKLTNAADVSFGLGDYLLPSEPAHPGKTIGNAEPERKPVTAQRIVRTTRVAEDVKKMYNHTCQICSTRLSVGNGEAYSEGAHIKALGGLHRGPDQMCNVLCLCPNCHVQFDRGAIVIDANRTVLREGTPAGTLKEMPGHEIKDEFLEYHRQVYSELTPR